MLTFINYIKTFTLFFLKSTVDKNKHKIPVNPNFCNITLLHYLLHTGIPGGEA